MKHASSRKLSLLLHRWHRRIGVIASLFVLWMVVSGWLLNHSDALGLPRAQLHNGTLLHWYGLHAELPQQMFSSAGHWLVGADNGAVVDGKWLPLSAPPLGLVAANHLLFVASKAEIKLLSDAGDLVDDLQGSALPVHAIARLGAGCGGAVVVDEDGARSFASNDGAGWSDCSEAVTWSQPQPISAAASAAAAPLLQPGISIERLLLDLHSGRFLGAWGPWLVDAAGAGFALLALSGLWMFAHHRRRRRERPPH